MIGDLRAQVAAGWAGSRGLERLAAEFGLDTLRAHADEIMRRTEAFGGMGGRPGDDGLASVSFPYNVRDVSIEWSEMETPVLYEARELIPDSGGAGEFRGGLGQELILQAYGGRVRKGEPLVLSGSAGRMRFPPRGLGGGGDGSYGVIEVNGEAIAPSSSPNVTFHEGDVVRLRLPGGGGMATLHGAGGCGSKRI